MTAGLLTEACHEVEVEPHLQPVTGEKFILTSSNTEDGARLDISANGFWGGRCEKTYIDVKVLTLMLSVTVPPTPRPFTENISYVRSVHMKHVYVKWNKVPLLL